MLDKSPTQEASKATQLIECPARRQAKPADPCAMVIFGASAEKIESR
jgi:hypothetical protein